jgi:4-hydroxy-3-methylbut-2-enyl diphosphate reductase
MPKNNDDPAVAPGSRIELHLEIRLQDGTPALSTLGEAPLSLTLGDGTLPPALEALMAGLTPGAEARFLVSGSDLYGPRDPNNVHWLPLADFPPDPTTEPGQVVAFDTPGGHEVAGLVVKLDADRVHVDFNHPLAGRPLDLLVQVLSVVPGPAAGQVPESAASTGQSAPPDLSSGSMNILIANPRGFCAGVDRAIDIVERAIELFGVPIYVRHEVVHNRFVVEDLRQRGAVFVEDLDQIPDGATVIFSAHGVAQRVREEAASRRLRVFDATCPLVTKVHLEVARHCKNGHEVILIGHRGHPEVEGTMGQCRGGDGRVRLVETIGDVAALEVRDPERLAYVTQTTLSMDDTQAIVAALRARFPAIHGPKKSDICYATQNRQDAVKALAERCDLVLVVGSANSSNSNRLRELAERQGCRAYLIDGPDDIRPDWLANAPRIGLTAGASAPEVLVQQVIDRLRARGAGAVEEQVGVREQVVFALPKELATEPLHGSQTQYLQEDL